MDTPGCSTILDTSTSGTTAAPSPWLTVDWNTQGIGLHLVANGSMDGAWKIEATNEPGATPVDPADITTGFAPSIVAVDHTNPVTQTQFVQCPLVNAGRLRATFNPTTGSGAVRVHVRNRH